MRLASAVAIAALLVSTAAAGPTRDDEERAAKMFERGRELMRDNRATEACPMFQSSLELVPALGTQLNLAICRAATGELRAALALYRDLIDKATAAGQTERAELARAGVAALEARLPRLVLEGVPPGAKVTVDDVGVDAATPIAVDPGVHRIVAIDPAGARTETTVTAVEGQSTKVVLVAAQPASPTPPADATDKPPRTRRVLFWTLAASSVVAIGAGLVYGGYALEQQNAAEKECFEVGDQLHCSVEGISHIEAGHARARVANVLIGAGIALGVSAAIVHFTAPRAERRTATRIRPAVSASGAALVLEGWW